jgi:hypothetical protein
MDYLFGQELEVELLESALDGSEVCRSRLCFRCERNIEVYFTNLEQ